MNRHRPAPLPADRQQSGMTLIELLVSMVISGIIVSAIAAALIAGFRTTGATTDRLGASHNTELIDNYFPRDVASAAPVGISTGTGSTGCSGPSPGTNVVLLPAASGPGDDDRRVAYRFDDAADTITRYDCETGSAATEITVARNVSSAQATVTTEADGQATVVLAVTVTKPAGRSFEVTGHSRTPTAPPPLPDAPTPTTAPPLPCKVDSSTITPNPVALAAGTNLAADVSVTITVSGTCVAPLTASFVPGSSGPSSTVTLGPSGSTYVATLAKSAYAWTTGTKTLTVGHAGPAPMVNPTQTFAVAPACTVSTATATPNPVTLASGTTLAADVGVAVTVSGLCSTPLSVSFVPGSSGSPVSVPLVLSGGTHTVTLGKSAYPWTTGAKTITVIQPGGVPVQSPTFSLTVNPAVPCVVTAATASPNPVNRTNSDRLRDDVTVTVTTTGTCSGLQIRYFPQASSVTQSLAQSGPTWSVVIPAGGPKWNAGPHTIEVLNASNSYAVTPTLTVNP